MEDKKLCRGEKKQKLGTKAIRAFILGSKVFLNPNGGGVALLTTTRLVYSTPNFELATSFNEIAYEKVDGEMPRLGDLYAQTKIQNLQNGRITDHTI